MFMIWIENGVTLEGYVMFIQRCIKWVMCEEEDEWADMVVKKSGGGYVSMVWGKHGK